MGTFSYFEVTAGRLLKEVKLNRMIGVKMGLELYKVPAQSATGLRAQPLVMPTDSVVFGAPESV